METKSNKSDYLFSVIIPLYNVEKYLKQTISSVINQTVTFEDHVQLILVDAGSTDDTLKIAHEFIDKYPHNIQIYTVNNLNKASMLNVGLEKAQGKYITFLDGDDYIIEDMMEKIQEFTEKNQDINIIKTPIYYFESTNREDELNYELKENRIFDLSQEENFPILTVKSTFIKKDFIEGLNFNEQLYYSEDTLFINTLLLKERKFAWIYDAWYYQRKRFDKTSLDDLKYEDKKFYTDRLINFHEKLIEDCKKQYGEIPNFIQYMLVYELVSLITVPELTVFESDDEKEVFWQKLKEIIENIDEDKIYKNNNIRIAYKSFFSYIKTQKYSISIENDDLILKTGNTVIDKLNNHRIWLDIVEIQNNKLNISGLLLSNFDISHLSINLISEYNGEKKITPCKYVFYPQDERKPLQLLSIPWRFDYNFDVSTTIEHDEHVKYYFEIVYDENGLNYSFIPRIEYRITTGFSNLSIYSVYQDRIIFKDTKSISTVKYTFFKMIKFEIKSILRILSSKKEDKYSASAIHLIYLLFYHHMRNKEIWLINDRLDSADDNAKHLFNYASKQQDNIKKYFIIDKNSEDYSKMKKINKNVVDYGSLKHKFLYLYSHKLISSFLNEKFFNPFYNDEIDQRELYSNLVTAPRYFLQHGVISCDLTKHIKRFNHNLSLIVTSSDLERNSFFDLDYNYPQKTVQALGLPRYDNLKSNNLKKQIVYIPSWRSYLDKSTSMFTNSSYYLSITSLLNNKKLNNLLKEYDYEFIFKPHPELVKYIDKFETQYVKISLNDSFQDLFNDSMILISDFSSVIFDFSYLEKPVIYYQPNEDYHYEKGYFDYETMGFGDIIKNEEDLIDKIKYYLENKCQMEDKYKIRVKNFFKFHDNHNSERVYNWIKNN